MSVRLYFDQNVSRTLALALRRYEIDVLTAREDGNEQLADERLLVRVAALNRLLVTNDKDFLRITTAWQREGRSFAGVVYFVQQGLERSQVIDDLRTIAGASDIDDWRDALIYLPL